MKRLLLLLLISTIAYAIIEDHDEYDDVSLEGIGSMVGKLAGKIKLPTKLPNVKLPTKLPNVKLPTKLPNIKLPTKLPNVKLPTKLPNVKLPTKLPNVKLPTKLPNIKLPTKLPNIKLPTKLPNVKLPTKLPNIPFVRKIIPKVKQIEKKVVIPLEKRIADPLMKRVNKFLDSHPTIKKISDPFIKELKKIDPKKSIKEILKDPQNAGKIIQKTLKPFIDKVKAVHPFKIIKGKIKDFENFLEKNKVPVKQIKSLFGNVSKNAKNAFNQLNQKGRNTLYWLKKNGYWEPLKFVIETGGQYAAESLCSVYLTPMVCEPVVDLAFTFVVNKYLDSL